MNELDYAKYLELAIPSYAKDNVDSGRWDESEALERSQKAQDTLLPDGIATKDNYLFTIVESRTGINVGHIWVKVEENIRLKSAFIYDIEIYEPHQRKGFAKSALAAIESIATNLGATSMGLHVFNHNSAAIALYDSIGYQTVSHNMQKPLNNLFN
jgi:ribosomal protein S18 acetylase RimI-like enzyme